MSRSWQVLTISTFGMALFCVTVATAVPLLHPIGGNLAHIVMGVAVAIMMDIGWTTRTRAPACVLQAA